MAKPLVIVESPAKAKTLARFLGDAYRIEASYGHVRDLPEKASEVPAEIRQKPWGRMAVDTDGDFTPYYVVPADKKKQVAALKAAVKQASELLLATDPDREGESISWHLREILKPKIPVRRIVFHEITEEAIREAIADAHDLDENLVKAQESRRILDRLYGYTLSPVLWKKVATGLSAGRVQSVAVRLIVEREEARRAFRSSRYWDLEARLSGDGRAFTATLVRVGDERLATGKDFDSGHRGARERQCPPARRGGGARAGRRARAAPAVGGDVGRSQARRRAAGPAVHHLHALAGSQPQARLLDRAHDAGGAAAVPGRRDRRRGNRRPHHLSPHGLDHAQRQGAERVGARHPRDVRRRVLHGAAPVPDAREERAGGPRGDPPHRLPDGAEGPGAVSRRRRTARLRTRLEAHDGVADARRAGAEDDGRDHRARAVRRTVRVHGVRQGDRVRRVPPRLRRGQRRPRRRTGGPGIDPAGREAGRSRGVRRGGGSGRAVAGGPRREGPRNAAARALHRGGAHQGTGAGGHRAAVHLRADHRHARAPRLHVQAGEGAGPELLGLRRHAPAARALRRLRRRRLHRRDGRGPRPDLERRARLGVVHPGLLPRRRRRAPGPRADGGPRGAEHRVSRHRHRHGREFGRAAAGARRPLRALHPARRRRSGQHGDAAEDAGAGRSHRREGARAAQGEGRRARRPWARTRRRA